MKHSIMIEVENNSSWMATPSVIRSFKLVEADSPEEAANILRSQYEEKGWKVVKCEPKSSPFNK